MKTNNNNTLSSDNLTPTLHDSKMSRIGLTLVLTAMMALLFASRAVAQTPVCGSTCGAGGWEANTDVAPAFASGSINYLAWKGYLGNYVWFTSGFPPSDWAWEKEVVAGGSWYAKTNVAPALTAYGAGAALAWKGQSGTSVWYSILSGGVWGLQRPIGVPQTNVAPAIASNAGKLYLAYTTTGNAIEYVTYNGAWSTTSVSLPPGAVTTLAPAVTVYNNLLYFAWTTPSNTIQYISCNPTDCTTSWSPIGTVMIGSSPATTNVAPALTTGSSYTGGPFLAWTDISPGNVHVANVTDWSVVWVANGVYYSNTTPALALNIEYDTCETFYYLYVAFKNSNSFAIDTNLAHGWPPQVTTPCTH